MTDTSSAPSSAPVPTEANPADAIRARWAWVAPEVWTERMLTARDKGVKGGHWYTLMDKVSALPTLRVAFARVKATGGAAGIDHVPVAMYARRLDANLTERATALRMGTDQPQLIRRHWIPKPGTRQPRPRGIPTVRDRVVQTAGRLVPEPIFEVGCAEHSDGFRPRRGTKDAWRRVEALRRSGDVHVVDADLQSYFDSIPHAPLRARVQAQGLFSLMTAHAQLRQSLAR